MRDFTRFYFLLLRSWWSWWSCWSCWSCCWHGIGSPSAVWIDDVMVPAVKALSSKDRHWNDISDQFHLENPNFHNFWTGKLKNFDPRNQKKNKSLTNFLRETENFLTWKPNNPNFDNYFCLKLKFFELKTQKFKFW